MLQVYAKLGLLRKIKYSRLLLVSKLLLGVIGVNDENRT